jgi:hypothetical protein
MISEAEHSQGQRLGTEETIMYPRDLGDDETYIIVEVINYGNYNI